MSVFFTSDIHIGHTTIAKIRYGASELPVPALSDEPDEFESDVTDWHDNWLGEIWDNTLNSGDIMWLLGDISSGTKSGQLGALSWVDQRIANTGCEVHLVTGTHDDAHPMHRDSHKWQPVYLRTFKSVQVFSRRRIPYDHEGHADAFLSHFPYHGDHGKERYVQYRLPDMGRDFVIHGHTHSSKRFGGRQLHVGVDAWQGRPVPLDNIVAYVNGRWTNKPSDRPVSDSPVLGVSSYPLPVENGSALTSGASNDPA